MKFQDLITKFEAYLLTEKRVSPNTFVAYKQDLAQFTAFLAKKECELDALKISDLKRFLHYLHDKKLSARSVARKISALKALFNYLHVRHDMKNLAQELYIPKIEKKLPAYLTEQEIEQLFDVAEQDTSPQGIRNKVMIYLLYVSGMRVTELTQLKVSDIQFDTGFISIHGKGGKQRMVPVPQPILAMLREYINGPLGTFMQKKTGSSHAKYLFPICYGGKIRPISRQAFWVILKGIWRQSGIKRAISPHKLRHSFATHMLKKGVNLRSLQLLLGHENLSTVQVYTHVETSFVRKIYDRKHPRS